MSIASSTCSYSLIMTLHSTRFVAHIIVLSLIIFSSCLPFSVSSVEFEVGGNIGWIVPPANDSEVYNHWASENRFQVEDTLRFEYRKDSVMEVNEKGYKNCNSTKPNFFSNNGNTVFPLHRSGYFYFISGASGHCERGQRLIVRVLAQEPQDSRSGSTTSLGSTFAPALIIPASTFQFLLLYLSSHIF